MLKYGRCRNGKCLLNGTHLYYITMVEEAKHLVAELCANLYQQGHVSGTGGGISIKVGDKIVMAPSGVQKERMVGEDMFVLDDKGEVIHTPPAKPAPHKPPKLSECAPLFMSVRCTGNARNYRLGLIF